MTKKTLKANREAQSIFYGRTDGRESFASFLDRKPRSVADVEIWARLDERFGATMPAVRQRYHRAGETTRMQHRSFAGYLRELMETTGYSARQLARMARASEESWALWLAGDERAPRPSAAADLTWLLVTWLGLSRRETAFVDELATEYEAVLRAAEGYDRLFLDLTQFLRRTPEKLGPALAALRGCKGFSIEKVAWEAGVSPQCWRQWEQGLVPDLETLDAALSKVFWIWTTDCTLRDADDHAPVPGRADSDLWIAFLKHRQDDDESLYLPADPSPSARAAFLQANRIFFSRGRSDASRLIDAMGEIRINSERSLGEFLRYRREIRERSLDDVANITGIDVPTLAAWETGASRPAPDEVERVAQSLFVTQTLRDRMLEIYRATAA